MSPIFAFLILLAAAAVGAVVSMLATRRALRTQLHELRGQARTGALTGFANRRTWEEELPRELARSARTGRPVSLVLCDIDGFKAVNDGEGHQAGDRILTAAARAWRASLRDVDVLARFGGDEFGFVLTGCAQDEAVAVAERLRTITPAGVTCSLGVAGWDGTESAATLFARADQALYAAKEAGRDRVVAARRGAPTQDPPALAQLVPALSY